MCRYFILLVLLCITGFADAQIRYSQREAAARGNRVAAAARLDKNKADTIPISRNKYFKVDERKLAIYRATLTRNDSVKLQIASAKDWSDFNTAYTSLKNILGQNPYDNVLNYIDTTNDFNELKLVTQQFVPNTAKVCLRQLIFNVNLVNRLLQQPLQDKNDVELLSAVISNIDSINRNYVVPFGNMMTRSLNLPNVSFIVKDKSGNAINSVQCYLISNKTCRDIACKSCVPIINPCDNNNITSIISRPDGTYDTGNPTQLRLNYGHYHLFVLGNNKILHYEMRHINENSLSTTGKNEITITLQ